MCMLLRTPSFFHQWLPQCFHTGNPLTPEAGKPGIMSPFMSMWLWTSNLTLLSLGFFIYKMGIAILMVKGYSVWKEIIQVKCFHMKLATKPTSIEWQLSSQLERDEGEEKSSGLWVGTNNYTAQLIVTHAGLFMHVYTLRHNGEIYPFTH